MTLRKIALTAGSLALFAILIGALFAGTPAATAAPPPRPTLTPTPSAVTSPKSSYLELHVPGDNKYLWTAVQWQDSAGNWHTVEGWQGILDNIHEHVGIKQWQVYPRDYGKYPFRWLVYQSQGGKLLTTSYSFRLPGANQRVIVEVTLPK